MHVTVQRTDNGFSVTVNPGLDSPTRLRELCIERATGESWAGAAARAAQMAETAFGEELLALQDRAAQLDNKEAEHAT